MIYFKRLHKILSLPLVVLFMLSTLPIAAVNATVIGTDQVINQASIKADRDKVIQFVEREQVQKEMSSLGVDPAEAKLRIMALSDSEIQQLSGKIDQLPAGEGAAAAVIGGIVLLIVLLIFTDILCLTDVFDFVNCSR